MPAARPQLQATLLSPSSASRSEDGSAQSHSLTLLNGQAFWWCAWFRICKQERCANIEEPLYRVWSVECRCRLTRHRLVKIVISSADRSPTKLLIFIHVMYSLTCTTPPRHTHNPELWSKETVDCAFLLTLYHTSLDK